MMILLTYVIALAGAGLFHVAHLPLPWLLGPIVASVIAALFGVKLQVIKPIHEAGRTILGVAVGATITLTLLYGLVTMWPSLLILLLMVCVIGAIGVPYFMRVGGYDFTTSYYSAMPGGLQDMLIFGEEAGGNVRTLSLVHATRILVIVLVLPFLLEYFWHVNLDNPPGISASEVSIDQFLWMIFAAIFGWRAAKYIGMFGASILGPLMVATILSVIGVLHVRPPAEAIYLAQFLIGAGLGTKYVGLTMQELRHDIWVAGIFCLILVSITLIFYEIITLFTNAQTLETLLSFTPGGQAEMTVLALVVGADVGVVILHHVFRILIVIVGAPIVAKFVTKFMVKFMTGD